MKNHNVIVLVVSAFAVAAIGCGQAPAGEQSAVAQTSNANAQKPDNAVTSAAPDKVVAYYFHNTKRCRTCLGIEETIAQTIQENFIGETGSGLLTFQSINLDEQQNRHFAQDFEISFSTFVVAATKDGKVVKWEKFDGVWDRAREPEALAAYTISSLRKYLDMVEK